MCNSFLTKTGNTGASLVVEHFRSNTNELRAHAIWALLYSPPFYPLGPPPPLKKSTEGQKILEKIFAPKEAVLRKFFSRYIDFATLNGKVWIFCETTKGKNVWSNGKRFLYPLDERACFFPFALFFLSQQLQPLFGSCETPSSPFSRGFKPSASA